MFTQLSVYVVVIEGSTGMVSLAATDAPPWYGPVPPVSVQFVTFEQL